MTREELSSIRWRLASHMSMSSTHCTTYEGEWNGITITRQCAARVLENGGFGKMMVAYSVGQRKFKSKVELIKYLYELELKGDSE